MSGRIHAPHEPDLEPGAAARVSWRDVGCAWLIVCAVGLAVALLG